MNKENVGVSFENIAEALKKKLEEAQLRVATLESQQKQSRLQADTLRAELEFREVIERRGLRVPKREMWIDLRSRLKDVAYNESGQVEVRDIDGALELTSMDQFVDQLQQDSPYFLTRDETIESDLMKIRDPVKRLREFRRRT